MEGSRGSVEVTLLFGEEVDSKRSRGERGSEVVNTNFLRGKGERRRELFVAGRENCSGVLRNPEGLTYFGKSIGSGRELVEKGEDKVSKGRTFHPGGVGRGGEESKVVLFSVFLEVLSEHRLMVFREKERSAWEFLSKDFRLGLDRREKGEPCVKDVCAKNFAKRSRGREGRRKDEREG